MLVTFLVLQEAQQTQLAPGGPKVAAGNPEDCIRLPQCCVQSELWRNGESLGPRGSEQGLLLNVRPGPGFPCLPSALPGSNEILQRQISIDGLQTQKQLNTLISADVFVF